MYKKKSKIDFSKIPSDKPLTQEELAGFLHTGTGTVRFLRESKIIGSIKLGHAYIFPRSEVNRFLDYWAKNGNQCNFTKYDDIIETVANGNPNADGYIGWLHFIFKDNNQFFSIQTGI